jgi:hypothetical protein
MGRGTKWHGANFELGRPKGWDEQQCNSLHVFRNGRDVVSCWELSDEEIAEIVKTRRVFLLISGMGWTMPPAYIGLEEHCREMTADVKTWKRANEKDNPVSG